MKGIVIIIIIIIIIDSLAPFHHPYQSLAAFYMAFRTLLAVDHTSLLYAVMSFSYTISIAILILLSSS
jgi:hypothetical protein